VRCRRRRCRRRKKNAVEAEAFERRLLLWRHRRHVRAAGFGVGEHCCQGARGIRRACAFCSAHECDVERPKRHRRKRRRFKRKNHRGRRIVGAAATATAATAATAVDDLTSDIFFSATRDDRGSASFCRVGSVGRVCVCCVQKNFSTPRSANVVASDFAPDPGILNRDVSETKNKKKDCD
jgi:hypothetical protein